MITDRRIEILGEKPPQILLTLPWSGTRVYVVGTRRITSRRIVQTLTATCQPSVITQLKHFVYTAAVRCILHCPSTNIVRACNLQCFSLFASLQELLTLDKIESDEVL